MIKLATYHGYCADGATAAAIFLRKYPDAIMIPVISKDDEDAKEEVIKHSKEVGEIYVLDNAYFAKEYLETGKRVNIIDHHVTNEPVLQELSLEYKNLNVIFDLKESGASLTWKYLFPNEDLPRFVWHIRDGDLWNMEDEHNTQLTVLYTTLFLDNLNKLQTLLHIPIEEIYEKAEPIFRYRDNIVNYYLRNAQALHLRIGEHTVKAYNVASVRDVISIVGNKLSEITKETVVLFKVFGNRVNLSFRSNEKVHGPSAAELATLLGGGGHKYAAGASIHTKDFINSLEI